MNQEQSPVRCETCKENPVTNSWEVYGIKHYLCLKCWNEFCDRPGYEHLKDKDEP